MPKARWYALRVLFDASDVMTAIGLALMALGLWDAWRPGAFLVPGIVLVWYGLPTRPPFVAREKD